MSQTIEEMNEEMRKSIGRSKVGRMSKRKGSRFELNLAKQLDLFWKVPKGTFRRCPLSGGFDARFSGDLIVPNDFPCLIEAKDRESWHFNELFKEGKGKLLDWWLEQEKICSRQNKLALLIFTKKYQPDFIMFGPKLKPILKFLKYHVKVVFNGTTTYVTEFDNFMCDDVRDYLKQEGAKYVSI